jgi:hypothetical protein
MQSTLSPYARMLVGLGAAAGAFGAAAMMTTATAPTARADAYSEIIASVDGDLTAGQGAFTTAFADFASNQLANGLAGLIDGFNDDGLSAPANLLVGSVEALTSETITASEPWGLGLPASFSDALAYAQALITEGEGYFTTAATDLAGGDYGDAVLLDSFGADFVSIVPLEELLLGAAVSF